MISDPNKKRYEGFERRILLLAAAITLAFGILGMRLWHLQMEQGDYYLRQAQENRLHVQRIKAPRGMIYGRHDKLLADYSAACDIGLVPGETDPYSPEEICRRLARLIHLDAGDLDAVLLSVQRTIKARAPYTQITVKRDVSWSELTRVQELSYTLPGVFLIARPQRRYLYGKSAGHILGYLGEVGPGQLERADSPYKMGDLIGLSGLESVYEDFLRGQDGHMLVTQYADARPQLRTDPYGRPLVERDSFGRHLEFQVPVQADPGNDLRVTLDIGLQAKAEKLLEGEIGAIAVLDADTGAVFALASTPNYDPSIFVTQGRNAERLAALNGKLKPMRNRCLQEDYHPGSVFKIVMAAVALEKGIIREHDTFYCPGHFMVTANYAKKCWKHSGHGAVNIVDAMAYSCDVFFYNVGKKLHDLEVEGAGRQAGVDLIHEAAIQLGLAVETGIDLPIEVEGLIPNREWKKKEFARRYPEDPYEQGWYLGDTLNLSIGQWDTKTTPLQNAVLMASIVNGGYHVTPYLDERLRPETGSLPQVLRPETVDIIRKGMQKCVDKDTFPTGTGRYAKIPGMAIVGKTGSAQVTTLSVQDMYETEEDLPYELRDHAWFVAGVLDREPRLAICVLVEHGHHGSTAAAPLAKAVIEYFYANEPGGVSLAKNEGAR